MPSATVPAASTMDGAPYLSRHAPGIIAALFCGYLAVGLPLPVIPLFVHNQLEFGSLAVGLTIGIQFLATVLTRGYAGRITDNQGGKVAALRGAIISVVGSLFYLAAAIAPLPPGGALTLVVIARIVNGLGESLFVTGCVSWSVASVGPTRAGMSMSWTGIAMFAALAIGAPVGMALYQAYGLQAAMIACIAAPLVGGAIALGQISYHSPAGRRISFLHVVGQIWREGAGLMLQGVGLSGLTAFASLYFAARGWIHAGWVMTAFGIGFIFMRVALANLPDRMGGYRVALWSLVVEAIGQAMLWVAPNEMVALGGALVTGLGCALVFPAFGVEVLKRIPPASRGSAMGGFVAFLDIAYGLAGPAAGLLAGKFGFGSVYLFGVACALAGALLAFLSSRVPASAEVGAAAA